MATVYYKVCDRCGAKIEEFKLRAVINLDTATTLKPEFAKHQYDLCGDCFIGLNDFLKEGDKEKKKRKEDARDGEANL